MKVVLTIIAASVAWVFIMIGMDVFGHDQTFSEAWKGSPQQFLHSLGELASLMWQYKVVSLIALGILVAVLIVRLVPDMKNQAQR